MSSSPLGICRVRSAIVTPRRRTSAPAEPQRRRPVSTELRWIPHIASRARVAALIATALALAWPVCLPAAASVLSPEASLESPLLVVESPPSLTAQAEKIRRYDTSRLLATVRLVGLEGAAASTVPIHVVLSEASSDTARAAPEWATGYAQSERNLVVLIPSRSFSYPHDSLEEVLQHEIAHILIHRAARGHPVPRWFNEGLAMAAARRWDIEDRTRLMLELLPGDRLPFREVDGLFEQGSGPAHRAYALSGDFVRVLLETHGEGLPARILSRVGAGESFEQAFESAAGIGLEQAEADFYRRENIWSRWIPFLSSALTLWTAITVLALVAIRKRRQKDARIEAEWEAEEAARSFPASGDPDTSSPSSGSGGPSDSGDSGNGSTSPLN